jgi:hypothetical protein
MVLGIVVRLAQQHYLLPGEARQQRVCRLNPRTSRLGHDPLPGCRARGGRAFGCRAGNEPAPGKEKHGKSDEHCAVHNGHVLRWPPNSNRFHKFSMARVDAGVKEGGRRSSWQEAAGTWQQARALGSRGERDLGVAIALSEIAFELSRQGWERTAGKE